MQSSRRGIAKQRGSFPELAQRLVAPAFLLVSGGVIGHSTCKSAGRMSHSLAKGWRTVEAHRARSSSLPTCCFCRRRSSGNSSDRASPHLIALWTKMDILQCVRDHSPLILLLVPLARNPACIQLVCTLLGILAVAGLGFVDRWGEGSTLPRLFAQYLWPTGLLVSARRRGPQFPLLGVWLVQRSFVRCPP